MEGIKHEFSGNIDSYGNLRIKMVELRDMASKYPNKQVIVTVEVLDGGDVEVMKAWYRNYVLPKVVEAWRELGESYTAEQVDVGLRSDYTTSCHQKHSDHTMIVSIEELDRDMMKRYLDEVTIFCSTNLNLAL